MPRSIGWPDLPVTGTSCRERCRDTSATDRINFLRTPEVCSTGARPVGDVGATTTSPWAAWTAVAPMVSLPASSVIG